MDALELPDGIYYGIEEEIYHQLPYFSSTYARALLSNPAKAQLERKKSRNMVIGSAVHALYLEGRAKYEQRYVVVPADAPARPTRRQVEAKKPSEDTIKAIEWWNAFDTANACKETLTVDEAVTVEGCCKALPLDPRIQKRRMFQGKKEVTIIYTDALTGIRCKSRLDCLNDDGCIDDLKTTADASEYGFSKSIAKFGYYAQAGSYICAAASVGLEFDNFRIGAVSTEPPHQVIAGSISKEYIERGMMEFGRALQFESECRQMGFYPNIEIPAHLPSLFAIYNEDGTVKNEHDLWVEFDVPRYMP